MLPPAGGVAPTEAVDPPKPPGKRKPRLNSPGSTSIRPSRPRKRPGMGFRHPRIHSIRPILAGRLSSYWNIGQVLCDVWAESPVWGLEIGQLQGGLTIMAQGWPLPGEIGQCGTVLAIPDPGQSSPLLRPPYSSCRHWVDVCVFCSCLALQWMASTLQSDRTWPDSAPEFGRSWAKSIKLGPVSAKFGQMSDEVDLGLTKFGPVSVKVSRGSPTLARSRSKSRQCSGTAK